MLKFLKKLVVIKKLRKCCIRGHYLCGKIRRYFGRLTILSIICSLLCGHIGGHEYSQFLDFLYKPSKTFLLVVSFPLISQVVNGTQLFLAFISSDSWYWHIDILIVIATFSGQNLKNLFDRLQYLTGQIFLALKEISK